MAASKKRNSRRSSRRGARSAIRYTTWVVRCGGTGDPNRFLKPDGTWGPYKKAKRFTHHAKATAFYKRFFSSENYGLFPVNDALARR
jgi:hypothetical protein